MFHQHIKHINSPSDEPLWERSFAYLRLGFPAFRSIALVLKNSMKAMRPLAYSSEVGVSLKSKVPKNIYRGLWGASIGYVLVDTGVQVHALSEEQGVTNDVFAKKAIDTMLWHSLGSLVIPGVIIHKIVDIARLTVPYVRKSLPLNVIRLYPPLLGLAAIPLIIHPIDHFTDFLLDNTMRKMYSDETRELIVGNTANEDENEI